MKKQEHVKTIEEAMKWLNLYDYRVWDEISKRTERTAYHHDVKYFDLEEHEYTIIASDKELELVTDSTDDVIQFVNEMIDCFNEMK